MRVHRSLTLSIALGVTTALLAACSDGGPTTPDPAQVGGASFAKTPLSATCTDEHGLITPTKYVGGVTWSDYSVSQVWWTNADGSQSYSVNTAHPMRKGNMGTSELTWLPTLATFTNNRGDTVATATCTPP